MLRGQSRAQARYLRGRAAPARTVDRLRATPDEGTEVLDAIAEAHKLRAEQVGDRSSS